MIIYTTGDILKSSSEALVNTVNCEGYMGKGIAYQFKLKFPNNNKDYIKACKTGALRIGKLHYFREDNKLIINFPTKDKWRAKSKMEYIEKGLDELIPLINELGINSISMPPLGSGNGGLNWSDVKKIIEEKLSVFDQHNVNIYIYEPSRNFVAQPKAEPQLSLSALVLMRIKNHLDKFDTLRLQKTAFYMDVFSGENYFNFKRHKFGPHTNSIAIVSRSIKEFQKYYQAGTDEAYKILYNKIVSGNTEIKLAHLEPFIKKASEFVNSFQSNHELECVSTITQILKEKDGITEQEVVEEFKNWSDDKAKRFTEEEVLHSINKLVEMDVLEKTLTGFSLKR